MQTDAGDIDARRLVLALPLEVLRRMSFTPALPAWKLAALDRVALGHAAKLHTSHSSAPRRSGATSPL